MPIEVPIEVTITSNGTVGWIQIWLFAIAIVVNAVIAAVAVRSILPKAAQVTAYIDRRRMSTGTWGWYLVVMNLGPSNITDLQFPNDSGNSEFSRICTSLIGSKSTSGNIQDNLNKMCLPVLENGQRFPIYIGIGSANLSGADRYTGADIMRLEITYHESRVKTRRKTLLVPISPVSQS